MTENLKEKLGPPIYNLFTFKTFSGVAAELTQALENSVRGQAVDLRATLNKCSLIFPELFGSESFSRSSSPQRIKVVKFDTSKEIRNTPFDL